MALLYVPAFTVDAIALLPPYCNVTALTLSPAIKPDAVNPLVPKLVVLP